MILTDGDKFNMLVTDSLSLEYHQHKNFVTSIAYVRLKSILE